MSFFQFLFQKLANQEIIQSDHDCLRLVNGAIQSKMESFSSIRSPNLEPGSRHDPTEHMRPDDQTLMLIVNNFGKPIHQKLDRQTNIWTQWVERDVGRIFEAVLVDEQMLLIGGIKNSKFRNSVEIYNFRSKKWRKGPRMNATR